MSTDLQWVRDCRRFREGDCHFLARAIQKRTGWPIYAFSYREHGTEWADHHAFVLMPDGRALDIEGPVTLRTMRRRWHRLVGAGGRIAEFDWRTLRGQWRGPDFGSHTYKRAAVIADELLAEVGHA